MSSGRPKKIKYVWGAVFGLTITIIVLLHGREKKLQGIVFDCDSGLTIASARVWIDQIGWGFRDWQLVWGKSTRTETISSRSGEFSLTFSINSAAHLFSTAEGYQMTEGWVLTDREVKIGLKKGTAKSPLERIKGCRPISECMKVTNVNGVQVAKDICPEI